jgi:hypothetical protein
MIRYLHRTVTLLLLGALTATPLLAEPTANRYDRANGAGDQLLLRAAPEAIDQLSVQYGLTVVGTAENAEAPVLVEVPENTAPEAMAALLLEEPSVARAEVARLAVLPATGGQTVDDGALWADLTRTDEVSGRCLGPGFGAPVWGGFGDQQAVRRVRLAEAHLASDGCGEVTVAVIDTGIDPEHPLLQPALVPGYDFLTEEAGVASDWNNLDQSVQVIVEQEMRAIADQSVQVIVEGGAEIVVLDESMAPVLDPQLDTTLEAHDLPAFFGHGTMVAGLVRLVAPSARIMPLRVFDGSGSAHLFDIVRAIRWAVDHGADVINMSFSMQEHSTELREALRYARDHGVVCVAAAGNQGLRTLVYPAALADAVGVAATDLDDALSPFSNHGSQLVRLAAPGSGVISTYPGGNFAAGWGTSFSTPLVTGAIALIHHHYTANSQAAYQQQVNALAEGAAPLLELSGEVGSGRLDLLGTVLAAE